MSTIPDLPIWVYALLFLSIPISALLYDLHKCYIMPPGPRHFPFLGNRGLLSRKPWVDFEALSKVYGPIFTIWIGRKPMIVVTDPIIAVDLLEKRSSINSSRPHSVVFSQIYKTSGTLMAPYGKSLLIRRKLMHRALNPAALRFYKPVQEAEAQRVVWNILQNPAQWMKELNRFTSSIVFCIAFGHRIDSFDSKTVQSRVAIMTLLGAMLLPGAYLAETLPFLRFVPSVLAPWKRWIEQGARNEARQNLKLIEGVKRDIALSKEKNTEIPESLAKIMLEIQEKEGVPLSEQEFNSIPAGLFGAGADTTASTICSAFLTFVAYPHILEIAYKEIIDVVGVKRSPTWEDQEKLPYLKAFINEVLRWRPVAVTGAVPHVSTAVDTYESYTIPKGTSIMGCVWAINRNEAYYPEPDVFDPARFLPKSHPLWDEKWVGEKQRPGNEAHSSFGWGRRICPGEGLARNTLYITLAKLIWGLKISGLDGKVYDTFDYVGGINPKPRAFDFMVESRSEDVLNVLEEENMKAEGYLEKYSPYE